MKRTAKVRGLAGGNQAHVPSVPKKDLRAAGVTGALAAGRSTGGNSTVVICPDVAPFECTPDHPAVLQVTPGYDLYPCQDYWNAYDYPCPGSTRKSTCTFDLSTVNVTEELVASYLADKCDNTAGCQAFTYIAAYHLAFLKGANSGETFHVEERCTTDNKTSLWVKTSSAKPFPGKSHTGAIVGSVIGVLLALALAAVAAPDAKELKCRGGHAQLD
ncbi:hypothetical protein WJX72_009815 [[Myrmecia] bisecta]|uniref:Uncharacterized protein n=1 Tax=[Myrmecia] bisecta TaxID=41462 RepID=A0AAW1Q4Z2_9CHLO